MLTDVWGGFTAFEGFGRLDAHRPARSGAHVSVQDGQPRPGRPGAGLPHRRPRLLGRRGLPPHLLPVHRGRPLGGGVFGMTGEPEDQERRTAAAPRPRLRRRRPRPRRAAADRLRGLGHPPATGASPGTSSSRQGTSCSTTRCGSNSASPHGNSAQRPHRARYRLVPERRPLIAFDGNLNAWMPPQRTPWPAQGSAVRPNGWTAVRRAGAPPIYLTDHQVCL